MRRPGSHERVLGQFRSGELQILLGTQMIAKGLDFPNVLLVGVINADSALHFPDFRASERTFQLVTQVAAGPVAEKNRPGAGADLTPEHQPSSQRGKHDFLNFASEELKEARAFWLSTLWAFGAYHIRGPELMATESFADSFAARLQTTRTLQGIGRAHAWPCPAARWPSYAAKYRFHIMLHTAEPEPLNRLIVRTIADISNHPKISNS